MRANLALALLISGCTAAYAESDRVVDSEARVHDYAENVLHRLLIAAADQPKDWRVIVLDEDELALHVLPGRVLALDAGLARFVHNEGELAAVIAHELGHRLAQHGWDDTHSATSEREASRIAARLASEAGFAPADGVELWRRLAKEKGSYFVRNHPEPEVNLQVLEEEKGGSRI
jgi:predicted Zn-dependent protease